MITVLHRVVVDLYSVGPALITNIPTYRVYIRINPVRT